LSSIESEPETQDRRNAHASEVCPFDDENATQDDDEQLDSSVEPKELIARMFPQPVHKITRPPLLGLAEELNLGEVYVLLKRRYEDDYRSL
jgi:hypothetical protein